MKEFIEVKGYVAGSVCIGKNYVHISDITGISEEDGSELQCKIFLANGIWLYSIETTYESLKKTINEYYESKKKNIADSVIAWLEKQSKQHPEVDTLIAFKNAMKGEQRPEPEHKAKFVENDICRECDNGNWISNLCWKGHSRCDGQNCIDFEKDEEL